MLTVRERQKRLEWTCGRVCSDDVRERRDVGERERERERDTDGLFTSCFPMALPKQRPFVRRGPQRERWLGG